MALSRTPAHPDPSTARRCKPSNAPDFNAHDASYSIKEAGWCEHVVVHRVPKVEAMAHVPVNLEASADSSLI